MIEELVPCDNRVSRISNALIMSDIEMNIADGSFNIFVSEQLLESDQIGAVFEGM
jgi:hypothetical protein